MTMKQKIFINGKLVDGVRKEFTPVVNPATEEIIGQMQVCTEEDVNSAVAAAEKAFEGWSKTTPEERSSALMKIADIIENRIEELGELESRNVGKPLADAKGEVGAFANHIRFFAGAARNLNGLNTGEYATDHTSMVRREPIGVVGAITPWNFPLMMVSWKIGPALAAGNTVVLKPSELTPLTTLRMAELIADFLPPGVLNIVTGDGETVGKSLVKHPDVKMISLTGSVRAGQSVAKEAAATLKKVHLELGGKAPAIIYDDADIDEVVAGMKKGGFANSGQDCTAPTRLYISSKIYDEVVDKVVAAAESIKVGDPKSDETEMGSLVSKEHLNRVHSFVERAREDPDVKILTGGYIMDQSGYYYKPTVIEGTKQSDEINQSEVFGPVITVIPFDDDEQVIELANDTKYGLAASVWTKNIERAMKTIQSLNFGSVWINEPFKLVSEMPHGGSKMSGYGNDQSMFSVEEYTDIKHAMIKF